MARALRRGAGRVLPGLGAAGRLDVQARPGNNHPYVPYWSFGERLSVIEDDSSEPLGINYSLGTLAALLAHRLGKAGLLLESRDDFVAAARRIARAGGRARSNVFLSYDHANAFAAEGMREALVRRGVSVFMDSHDLPAGDPIEAGLDAAIERSDHMLVLVGDRAGERRWQLAEIRRFLRQAASDERPRFVVPILLEGTSTTAIPEMLRQYRVIDLGLDFDHAATEVVELLRPEARPTVNRSVRKCFLSFNHRRDLWRAQQIRNMDGVESQPLLDVGGWEQIRRRGEAAIAGWIDDKMRSKECLVVLVGTKTAGRKWVRFEIERAWREGLGLLAIHVHNLKDRDGRRSGKGADPFAEIVVDGRRVEGRVYDPPFESSTAVYAYIRENLEAWVSAAVASRG